jgi:hypothetical protein
LEPDAPEDSSLLVVAIDHLLRCTKSTWTQFEQDFWIDGPAAWGTDYPASEFVRRLRIPPTALNGVLLVIVAGYSVANGFQLPLVAAKAWRTI